MPYNFRSYESGGGEDAPFWNVRRGPQLPSQIYRPSPISLTDTPHFTNAPDLNLDRVVESGAGSLGPAGSYAKNARGQYDYNGNSGDAQEATQWLPTLDAAKAFWAARWQTTQPAIAPVVSPVLPPAPPAPVAIVAPVIPPAVAAAVAPVVDVGRQIADALRAAFAGQGPMLTPTIPRTTDPVTSTTIGGVSAASPVSVAAGIPDALQKALSSALAGGGGGFVSPDMSAGVPSTAGIVAGNAAALQAIQPGAAPSGGTSNSALPIAIVGALAIGGFLAFEHFHKKGKSTAAKPKP